MWVVEVRQEKFVDPFEGFPGRVYTWLARDDPLQSFSYRVFIDF